MPHPVSTLGAIHTAVSVATFVAGLYSYARHHQIEPREPVARGYLFGILVSVLTAFGLSSTGGFNVGHALGILALLAVGAALVIPKLRLLGRARPYLAQLAFAFSFFLLLVPGINETLTRLPSGQPLADGPESPLVRAALAGWLGIFVVGAAVHACWIRLQRRRAPAL